MWRIGLLVGMVCSSVMVLAQESKHFRVEQNHKYHSITLNYSSSSGVCYLAQGDEQDVLSVFSTRDIDDFNHSFDRQESSNNLIIDLSLDEKNNETFSQSISNKVFAKSKPEDNIWKVILTEDIPYNLNLSYGIGAAFIDLAGLSVSNLKVKTGSADVNIGYLTSMPNSITMDAMDIKVDLGNVNVRQIYLSNVRKISAEVGFGNMLLDLAEPMDESCYVQASVGAGTLEILIPKGKIPVVIRVKKSMLCDVKLTKSFKEIEENVFANMEFDASDPNLLEFDVDVSFGNIIFKEKR
jgi:hypothetical protein